MSDGHAIMIGAARLELAQGDIIHQDTEAIVNPANAQLHGGGGVDSAIHHAGGPSIMDELRTRYPGGCQTGQAVVTSGGHLQAKCVVHAVGPIYTGKPRDAELLAGTYRAALAVCSNQGIQTVAFPSISTGAYGFPIEQAAPIALTTIVAYLKAHPEITLVRVVLYDAATYAAYERALAALPAGR